MKKEKKTKIRDEYELNIRNLFARKLKKIRSERKMSQMELSSRANISTNFINDIEHERKGPSFETIAKLVKALGVEPAYFFTPETMIKTSNAEMLKAKLNSIITTVVNESIDSNTIYTPEIKPGNGKLK